ncbi:hypothetical protein JCM8547_005004 [Rhodosporidiobolus lusitaniae]
MLRSLFCLRNPDVDPSTQKALSLPIVNPFSRHGRIFFFGWLSFLLSFTSWYSAAALLPDTIKGDLNLTDNEIKNSTILGGVASLIVRLIAGPLCDRFGPRYVLVAALWLSAIPAGVAGTADNAMGLYFVRFFMGIAGAVFVPCQCLMAAWFDKRVIGTASAFAAGWGDAGVGVTFFLMPAVFNSFRHLHDLTERVAWRLSFVVPCILLLSVGLAVLLLNDDTPTGKWHERELHQQRRPSAEPVLRSTNSSMTVFGEPSRPENAVRKGEAKGQVDVEKQENAGQGEVVERRGSDATTFSTDEPAPPVTPKTPYLLQLKQVICLPTFMLGATYFSTFGCALTVNAALLTWYMNKFGWSQTYAGNWTALFGLLNIFARPLGGITADCLYRRFGDQRGLLAKKFWMANLCTFGGILALLVGLLNLDTPVALIALVSVFAIAIEAGNGATYALLPHVNSTLNGAMGGVVGASGNLGGIVGTTILRYSSIPKTIWVMGVISICVGLCIPFIDPIPSKDKKRTLYRSATTFSFRPSFR